MAKFIIEIEDTPDGVMITAHGDRPPVLEKDWKMPKQIVLIVKKILEEANNACIRSKWRIPY
ncbi:hypothetical protein ACI43T_01040 [Neisseria oralis]|uniref:Uncharacterized protein n=1 Tax=Neisseria oralis TaxID=1107316 RepID=A0ABW8Q0P3_9NEIS